MSLICLVLVTSIAVSAMACGRGTASAPRPDGSAASPSTGSSEFAKLTTPQVARLRTGLVAERKAAYGENGKFTVRGKIVQRGDERASIFGKALPSEGDPSLPGIHVSDACLFVENPKAHGQFMGDWYMATDIFYVGESTGENAFGASVPCSVYGDPPAKVKKAVAKVEERIEAVEQELRARTSVERQEAAKIFSRLEAIQSRQEAIEKEQSDLIAGIRNTPRDAFTDANQKLIDERNSLNREKQELDLRYQALKKRVDAIWEGEEVPSIEVMLAQTKAEADARRKAEQAKETDGLNAQMAVEVKALLAARSQLEADTRVHDQNILDMKRNGSNTKGEMAWFTEHKAAIEAQIASHEEKIAELEAKVRAVTGETAPPSTVPSAVEAAAPGAQSQETTPQQDLPPTGRVREASNPSSNNPAKVSAPRPPKNTAELARIQADIDRETASLKQTKDQLAAETRIHEQNLRDMQKSGSNPASTIKYFEETKAAREKRIRELEDKIAALEGRKATLEGTE